MYVKYLCGNSYFEMLSPLAVGCSRTKFGTYPTIKLAGERTQLHYDFFAIIKVFSYDCLLWPGFCRDLYIRDLRSR